MKTETKEVKVESKKDERILLNKEDFRINKNRDAINSIIPRLQTIVDRWNENTDLPKINTGDLATVLSYADENDPLAHNRITDFIINKGSSNTPLIEFGNRKVKFESAIKSGLIELKNIDLIIIESYFCRNYFLKKINTGEHTWEIIELVNNSLVFNEKEFEIFVETKCCKYASTKEQIEKYKLLKTMVDAENSLRAAKHISPIARVMSSDYVKIAADGSLIVNHEAI